MSLRGNNKPVDCFYAIGPGWNANLACLLDFAFSRFSSCFLRQKTQTLLMSKPGSGKGTQGQLIVSQLGYQHVSAGGLLRQELARLGGPDSSKGSGISTRMMSGQIVPSEITCRLLLGAMGPTGNQSRPFLIDGFPRNLDNLEGWQRCSRGTAITLAALLVDAPDDVCMARCLSRADNRPDDNPETLAKRLRSFEIDTGPVINELTRMGLMHRLDGTGNPELVFQRVKSMLISLMH